MFTYNSPGQSTLTTVIVTESVRAGIRLVIFSSSEIKEKTKKLTSNLREKSLEKIWYNFWWLEREASELFGTQYYYKNDTRNLLTEYFSTLKPMLRRFPSVGLFELFYDTVRNTLIHTYTSLQL